MGYKNAFLLPNMVSQLIDDVPGLLFLLALVFDTPFALYLIISIELFIIKWPMVSIFSSGQIVGLAIFLSIYSFLIRLCSSQGL